MSELSFGFPVALALPPLVGVAWILWMIGSGRSRMAASGLTRRVSPPRSVAVPLMLAAAAILAGFAAAQPRWGIVDTAVEQSAGSIVFAFDVSRSMDAQDVTPSRLLVAREAVAEAMLRLNGDRVGLVIFAGSARLRFPLTTDVAAAATVMRLLETGTFLVGRGTSTAEALELAVETLGGDGIVVLVTDGDDSSASAVTAARAFAGNGVELLIAPVGTSDGATIPVFNRSTGLYELISEDGVPVVTKLKEPFLDALAEASGGTLLDGGAQSLPTALPPAARDLRRSSATIDASLPIERFQWFAVPAVVFALLGMGWNRLGPRKVAPVAGVVLLMLVAACATTAYELNDAALTALDDGDIDGAVTILYEAAAEQPDDPEIAFNLSTVLHTAGRYREAIAAASRMERSAKTSVRARTQSLIGHHWFALGELERSLDAFRQALLLDSEDGTARRDYEVVFALLKQQEEAQQQPGNGSDRGGGEEPSDPGGRDGTQTAPGEGETGEQAAPRERPTDQDGLNEQLAALDREIEARFEEVSGPLTAEEALAILQLQEERNRLAAQRDGLRGFNSTAH